MIHNYTNDLLIKTGVYKITCKSNNKIYIGSASCVNNSKSRIGFLGRLHRHIYSLSKNEHRNKILQNSWNKYGNNNFTFEILEICDPDDCFIREQFYLDSLKPFADNNGFNICKNALSNYKSSVKNRDYVRDNSKINLHLRKPILQFSKDGKFIQEFIGVSNAATLTNTQRTSLYKCCSGRVKTANGFIWKYKNESDIPKNTSNIKYNIEVFDTLEKTSFIYKTQKEVCAKLDYCRSTIRIHLNNGVLIDDRYSIKRIIL